VDASPEVAPADATVDAGGSFSFDVPVDGPVPEHARVVVLWPSDSKHIEGDYVWVFGGGPIVNGRAFVHFPAQPPEEALNGGELGVGSVVVVNSPVPDGKLVQRSVLTGVMTVDHGVVFRAAATPTWRSWSSAFPLRSFACGRCVRDDADGELSGTQRFEPDDWSNVALTTASPRHRPCNWR
jgi:hypothetical protein